MESNAGSVHIAGVRLAGTILLPNTPKSESGSDGGLSKVIPLGSFPAKASTARQSCIVWLTIIWNRHHHLLALVWLNASILSWTVLSCIAREVSSLWWTPIRTWLWPANTLYPKARYPGWRPFFITLWIRDCAREALQLTVIPRLWVCCASSGLKWSSNDALSTFNDKGWPGAGHLPRRTTPESWGMSFLEWPLSLLRRTVTSSLRTWRTGNANTATTLTTGLREVEYSVILNAPVACFCELCRICFIISTTLRSPSQLTVWKVTFPGLRVTIGNTAVLARKNSAAISIGIIIMSLNKSHIFD